jgi:hypothetical protein
MRSNPCNGCYPLPFIVARGGAQGEGKKKYSARLMGCPVVRRCPSGRIEVELRYLVVGATAWPSVAVHPRTLGTSFE